jgi:hypothetical protein
MIVCHSKARTADHSVPRIRTTSSGSFDVKPRKSGKVSVIAALTVHGETRSEAICKGEKISFLQSPIRRLKHFIPPTRSCSIPPLDCLFHPPACACGRHCLHRTVSNLHALDARACDLLHRLSPDWRTLPHSYGPPRGLPWSRSLAPAISRFTGGRCRSRTASLRA